MKKKKVITILISFMLFIFISSFAALSYGVDTYNIIEKNKKIMNDIFIVGESLRNKGEVVGDVVAIVSELDSEGIVNGDILSGCFNGNIEGLVKGDLRIFSFALNINGEIRKNITTFSKDTIIKDNAIVFGSITSYSKNLKIYGEIESDIRGVVDTLFIDGHIKGDIDVQANNIVFGENANILGNLTYKSESKIDIPNGYVKGKIDFIEKKSSYLEYKILKSIDILILIKDIIFGISLCIIAYIICRYFPNTIKDISSNISLIKHKSFLYGITVTSVLTTIALILFITIIGIPISIILITLFLVLAYISKIPVAFFIGNKILKDIENITIKTIFGIIIIVLLSLIPVVGKIIDFIIISIGIGLVYFEYKNIFYFKKS